MARRRNWVALDSTPRILDAGSDGARAVANDVKPTAELNFNDAPRPSRLVLHPRVFALGPSESAYQPSAYILAADRFGGLLFRVTRPRSDDPADKDETMYLCSTRVHKAFTVPAAPYSDLRVEAQPRRSVGLIGALLGPGDHYLVAQLCPRPHDDDKLLCFSTAPLQWFLKPLHHLVAKLCPPSYAFRGDNLLCFSTDKGEWELKPLHTTTAVRMRNLCGETGVVALARRLYWINLAYGIFFCDPFAEPLHLRFVPLPAGCQVWEEEELSERIRANVAMRRRVAPSEGQLRYVEISTDDPSYDVAPDKALLRPKVRMWTLVDLEWRLEPLEALFDDVWRSESYTNLGLPFMEVPHVAFVDPNNHHVVYFLGHQGSRLYGLHLRTKEIVSCEDCPVSDDREIMLRNSRPIIDAWQWSPLPRELNNGERRDRWVIEHYDDWLDRM